MITVESPFGMDFGFSVKALQDYGRETLYLQEMELLSTKAIYKRKVEFCLGRAAAHSALSKINIFNFPVLKGENNEPLWPSGVVGAISHCDGIALAVVAPKEKTAGIGIDIEKMNPEASRDIAEQICTPLELDWVNKRKDQKDKRILMLFSAKESVFKVFFPISNIFLNFSDAELIWNEDTGKFSGKLLKNMGKYYGKGYIFEVGCRSLDEYIFTFMKLPPMIPEN